MLKFYFCIVLVFFSGCSEKKEKAEKNSFSQKLEHRNKTYSKTDVLLAIKYQLKESVIKEISDRITGEFRFVSDAAGKYDIQVDTNYALTVRTTIESLSEEYRIPQQIIASILIDRELLELPDAVGEEVVNRLSPSE